MSLDNTEIKQLVEKYAGEARVARVYDKVYKDECVYTHDTSESETGLYVCLNTFISVSQFALPVHFAKTNSHLYLHTRAHRRPIVAAAEEQSDEPAEKKRPTKLGIGIDGGFALGEKQFYFENDYALYVYPENKLAKLDGVEGSDAWIPERVRQSIKSIQEAESITQKEELASQAAAWDGEQRIVSKHSSTLTQLNNGVQISPDPASWKCEQCSVRANLWLNLTDGSILCGRRQLDGSGGNNHAVEHFYKSRHPLAVKLGTITATGADVYSYDEDDMVEDSNLAVHLSHFGINMSKMQKTEKTMTELEIDLNQKVGEWDRIQESGSKLVPVYGPGFTGMRNLGNSCYLNSAVQMLFTLSEFNEKYTQTLEQHMQLTPVDPSNDFNLQMAKLGFGLTSGRYSKPPVEGEESAELVHLRVPNGIKPASFKSLVGRGHVEFSTKRQQDAHEFLIYLFTLIERNLRTDNTSASGLNPLDSFKFKLMDRFECYQTQQVRYKARDELCLSLPVPKSLAINKQQVAEYEARKTAVEVAGQRLEPGDIVRPEIRLVDCLAAFSQEELITDFYSSAAGRPVNAGKTTGFGSYPPYLLIQARKFEHAADWSPVKLDISLQVPDVLDLTTLRSDGLRAGEVELPDDDNNQAAASSGSGDAPAIALNENVVQSLLDMGFSREGARRAAYHTRDANDAEAAVNWCVAHMEDADFNTPFEIPGAAAKKTPVTTADKVYDEEKIGSIVPLGFTRAQAIKALEATSMNVERAVDWIFNHPDELMDTSSGDSPAAATASLHPAVATYKDGNGVYKLIGFISHMGTNANVGHYVAHLLKDGKWTIFNDEHVALSENPPKDLAYLYLYQRV